MKRLFNAHVQLVYKDKHGEANVSSSVADRSEFWWNERKPDEPVLWESKIRLGEDFFNEIINHPVPIDMNTLDGAQALSAGPRSLPVVGVSDLSASCSVAALLADALPAVRGRSVESERPGDGR